MARPRTIGLFGDYGLGSEEDILYQL
jgi:hypothetical protein